MMLAYNQQAHGGHRGSSTSTRCHVPSCIKAFSKFPIPVVRQPSEISAPTLVRNLTVTCVPLDASNGTLGPEVETADSGAVIPEVEWQRKGGREGVVLMAATQCREARHKAEERCCTKDNTVTACLPRQSGCAC